MHQEYRGYAPRVSQWNVKVCTKKIVDKENLPQVAVGKTHQKDRGCTKRIGFLLLPGGAPKGSYPHQRHRAALKGSLF